MTDNNVTNALLDDLKSLIKIYTTQVNAGRFNEALNVWKNVQMLVQTISDIESNQNISKVFNDLSQCWNSLDQDSVSKALTGVRYKNEFNELISQYGKFTAIELECIKQNLYYSKTLAENLSMLKSCGSKKEYDFNIYKMKLNLAQYKNKTYRDTVIERNNFDTIINAEDGKHLYDVICKMNNKEEFINKQRDSNK